MPKTKTMKQKKPIPVQYKNENKEDKKPTYAVGGYLFKNKSTADAAQNEINAIKYMSSRTNRKDSAQVYLLYNKILDKKLFQTVIGMKYLKELQDDLYANDTIPNEKIRPIPLDNMQIESGKKALAEDPENSAEGMKKRMLRYKRRSVRLIIINAAFVIMLAVMFYILKSGSSTTIMNYEYNIQNKYASWDMELKSKEASLKERENKIKEKEASQNETAIQPTVNPTAQNTQSSTAATEKSSASR